MASPVTLSGGAFQDSQGNVLANGYLKFVLSQDGTVPGSGNISSGIEIQINLDANGNASGSIWGNDVITPSTFYRVTGYTAKGQPAWGPNNQQVVGATFNLSTWVPNQLISSPAQISAITLENNGVLNASQTLLNLESTDASITVQDLGAGNINLKAATGLPAGAQKGDTVRWNEYGDNAWDLVNGIPNYIKITANPVNAGVSIYPDTVALSSVGTNSLVTATATETVLQRYASAATASLNGVAAAQWTFSGGNVGHFTFGNVRKFSARVRFNQSANARWFVGLCDNTGYLNSWTTATDTPSGNYVAFRFSAGTDTTIKAMSSLSGTITTVDTTVALDTTNTQLFEIAYDGTNVNFFINGVKRASISTNIMATSTLIGMDMVGDNKNTANVVSLDLAWMQVTLK